MNGDRAGRAEEPVLGPRQASFMLRLSSRIIPEVAGAEPEVKRCLTATVDQALRLQPPAQRFLFKLLLFALQWMTVPFTLRRLDHLPPGWQDALLRFLESAPLRILRAGIWGIKTLVFMGYYGQETVERRVQYLPSKREGNRILEELLQQRRQ